MKHPEKPMSQVSYVSLQCSTCKQFGNGVSITENALTNTFTTYANLAYT